MGRRPAPPGLDRRQQILDAALDVFAEQGFEAATTKDIAARADVTHGLIYFYFKNKEDLFGAACEYQAEQVAERLAHVEQTDAGLTPETVLRHLIAHLVRLLDEPRTLNLLRVMMRTSLGVAESERVCVESRERMRLFGRSLKDGIQRVLDAQASRGALREIDVELASSMLLTATIHRMIARAAQPEPPDSADELADAIAEVYLFGILKETTGERGRPLISARPLIRHR